MSVFTHHPFYTNNYGNFGGLVRFIDDWDKHFSAREGRNHHQGRQIRHSNQSFTPRFDLRETEQDYQLHGELPGIEKKDVNIEFTDVQTIVIRGNVERTYTEGTAPAGALDSASTSAPITEKPHDDVETGSNKSFHATVEDEYESLEQPGAEAGGETSKAEELNKPETAPGEKARYWIYERSIGNFSRSFTFSSRVDHDNVSASLENGILTVVVPKAKQESRRIAIR
ncbi:30 kDa heat shock protein [Xylaria nigripes]|nr:30 kDa heat shock protein [Xylaria nigripes]